MNKKKIALIEKICETCHKPFLVKDSIHQTCRKYCSLKCSNYVELKEFTCKECGKTFIRKPSKLQEYKFCSSRCAGINSSRIRSIKSRVVKTCPICNKVFEVRRCESFQTYCSYKCGAKHSALHALNVKDHPNVYGIAGFRKDLKLFVRSKFEANYIRILKYLKEPFEYEKHTFDLGEYCYTPDLFLINKNKFLELKGRKINLHKLDRFKQVHPDKEIDILYQDSSEWRELEKKYQKLITAWEN